MRWGQDPMSCPLGEKEVWNETFMAIAGSRERRMRSVLMVLLQAVGVERDPVIAICGREKQTPYQSDEFHINLMISNIYYLGGQIPPGRVTIFGSSLPHFVSPVANLA